MRDRRDRGPSGELAAPVSRYGASAHWGIFDFPNIGPILSCLHWWYRQSAVASRGLVTYAVCGGAVTAGVQPL